MERFVHPLKISSFLAWLIELTNKNEWVAVFEYTDDTAYQLIKKIGKEVDLPKTVSHNYNHDCKLTACVSLTVNESVANQLIVGTHVLSVYDDKKLIFLIADDYHEDCFSCSPEFYDKYYSVMAFEENLIQVKIDGSKH